MERQSIKLKGLVDNENDKVLFVESGADFLDALFSFLTMPIGTIIKLIGGQIPSTPVGCMNNLYASVGNLDIRRLRTKECKSMLLNPRNGAAVQCKHLKVKIDSEEPSGLFYCGNFFCITSQWRLLSQYEGSFCGCGREMYSRVHIDQPKEVVSDSVDAQGGGFVKVQTQVVISDELKVLPPSTAACFSFLSKLGVMNASMIEERTFDIGVNEVLNLLKSSLVSETPLTKTLLKRNELSELSNLSFCRQSSSIKYQAGEHISKEKDKICARLILRKSKKKVCYAEVGEDFVDLLFSFLTIPLGSIMKEMNGTASKGCLNHLYSSIENLDAENYFKSNDHKEILLCPKIAPGFGYQNQLLRVDELVHQQYFYQGRYIDGSKCGIKLRVSTDEPADCKIIALNVKDPKSPHESAKTGGGYVTGPAMFTVTDDLNVTPISPVSDVSLLNKLNVPFSDTEECTVYVGNEEASRLLVAAFRSESALTGAFFFENVKLMSL